MEGNLEDEFDEDPRRELVEKLLEYQKFKNVIEEFKNREEQQRIMFLRNTNQLLIDFQQDENWVDLSIFDKWLHSLFDAETQGRAKEFFKKYLVPMYFKNGVGLYEIKNV